MKFLILSPGWASGARLIEPGTILDTECWPEYLPPPTALPLNAASMCDAGDVHMRTLYHPEFHHLLQRATKDGYWLPHNQQRS